MLASTSLLLHLADASYSHCDQTLPKRKTHRQRTAIMTIQLCSRWKAGSREQRRWWLVPLQLKADGPLLELPSFCRRQRTASTRRSRTTVINVFACSTHYMLGLQNGGAGSSTVSARTRITLRTLRKEAASDCNNRHTATNPSCTSTKIDQETTAPAAIQTPSFQPGRI